MRAVVPQKADALFSVSEKQVTAVLGTFSCWQLFHVGNIFDNYDLLYESAFPRSLINQHGVNQKYNSVFFMIFKE